MSVTENLLEYNRGYAERFAQGGRPAEPARGVAVVTCMDARVHPESLLGLELGDAHVLRNAGGRVTDDVLRSLIISAHVLGTREYLVIHHTRCGMLGATNDALRARVAAATGADASGIDFLPFDDMDDSVRDDVQLIRASPHLPADATVSGYVYDVDTGALSAVSGRNRE
ncbi:MAG: carbonic anhydrase [Egibacteraceae bacterium]